jgi:hypothetical protein
MTRQAASGGRFGIDVPPWLLAIADEVIGWVPTWPDLTGIDIARTVGLLNTV